MEAKLISVNNKLTKSNIRKFDVYGACERVAMNVCGSHKSICLDSGCIFCIVFFLFLLVRMRSFKSHSLYSQYNPSCFFINVFFFSASFTICLSNILAVDLFSYAGLHDTEQIIFWWVCSLAVLTHFLPLMQVFYITSFWINYNVVSGYKDRSHLGQTNRKRLFFVPVILSYLFIYLFGLRRWIITPCRMH